MVHQLVRPVLSIATSAIAFVSFQSAASAISLNFSYTVPTGDILSGMFEGEIQTDGDTVIVSDVIMPEFNGIPALDPGFLVSVSDVVSGSGIAPTVSFSGMFMDFAGCVVQGCPGGGEGFALFTGNLVGNNIGFLTGPGSYGGIGSDAQIPFEADRWELSVKTPEPSTILISLLFGSGAMILRRKPGIS
jgi:hypothetical protein